MEEYNKNFLITLLLCALILPFISACKTQVDGEVVAILDDGSVHHISRSVSRRGVETGVVSRETRESYQKASDKGDLKATSMLARIYLLGSGVRRDYAKAFGLYTKAAERGLASAQNNLGLMYDKGYGVKRG